MTQYCPIVSVARDPDAAAAEYGAEGNEMPDELLRVDSVPVPN